MSHSTIEVVCPDMTCFKVDATTGEPVSSTYYEPAAWNDPRGPQITYANWIANRPYNKAYRAGDTHE